MHAMLTLAAILLVSSVSTSLGVGYSILGKRILVKDPTGAPEQRTVIIQAKERPSDIAALSDPTVSGATLQIVLTGGTPSDDSYNLPAALWETTGYGYGYRYSRADPQSPSDPVHRVFIKKSPSGLVQMKVILKGTVNLSLVPPNPGSDANIFLDVTGGDRYCTGFGGAAGGSVVVDTQQQWKVLSATDEVACSAPSLPSCSSEYSPCGSCGDGICLLHFSGDPFYVCASQSGFSAGACTSSAQCTSPRQCATGGSPCPPFGECVLPCNSDATCDAALSPGFCAASTCPGTFCMVPCY
jgi:hypothetical protein